MFVFPSDPQAKPEAKDAVEKIKAGGFVPEGFTLFSYAVIQAFAEGIKRAGSDDPVKVAEALKNGTAVRAPSSARSPSTRRATSRTPPTTSTSGTTANTRR